MKLLVVSCSALQAPAKNLSRRQLLHQDDEFAADTISEVYMGRCRLRQGCK